MGCQCTFQVCEVQGYTTADIKIGFYRGNHGDGSSFDGRGGILAHAFAPQDGRFHYDADETWAVGATPGAHDLETVALHEIGHLLGLGHSSVEAAIMFARISSGSTKGLHSGDIQGIRALYNSGMENTSYQCVEMEYRWIVMGQLGESGIRDRLLELKRAISEGSSYSHPFILTIFSNNSVLESALKTYQLNYHLKVTGTLDSKTVSEMMMPRCGVPDIINGTTRMTSGKKNQRHSSTSFHTVSHYTFFPGSPKWPRSKYSLTYGFLPQTPSRAMDPVAKAFQTWAANTHFRFARVQDYTTADIKIGFYRGNHGDGSSFDGRGGILAHAFAPQDGRFHYDADETWAVGATPGSHDLETVALHEIGHLLGLGHSSVEAAIMFARISSGSTKGLHSDDIQGIRALYNV
ncbi:hypothetical protein GH714_041534 [Hevea brasiliensis]|uniref:Peptidase metallopeptidase domain-containing protein n=1 Tax=Hevea brasiliensis TaxID=3981 RepID=A0A6A6MVH4_HEVBR|nr:hypothetical protein GH714_041534 [Hevea brasiliensis]